MKGLLIKDFHLMLERKQTLLIFVVVCLITGFSIDGSFIMGYIAFLSALMAISTISYDDADNGMMFLMTLPISRKTYALSKYVLGGIFTLIGWVFSLVMMFGIQLIKGLPLDMVENISLSCAFLLVGLQVLNLMIPLQLKFGAEKSRIVMIIIFGSIAALGALLVKSGIIAQPSVILEAMNQIADIWYIAGAVLMCILLTGISIGVSIRIMQKKTF